MIINGYEVEILVNGKPVKEYLHNGQLFVEAKLGSRYSLRIKNNGWEEILAVPSVDGLSVMDGKLCSMHTSRGYIIKPYSSVTIDGWRTSDREIAEFYFSNPEDSYAERTDKASNVGVVGVAIFKKKSDYVVTTSSGYPWQLNNITLGGSSLGGTITNTGGNICGGSIGSIEPTTKVYCMQLSQTTNVSYDAGTGFGTVKHSEIQRKTFGRKDTPEAVFSVNYNTKEQLERLGIKFQEVVYATPEAFPGDYCKPPIR